MEKLANITGEIIGILKIMSVCMFIVLSTPKVEQNATEQLKKYIDLMYLRTILFIFILCA